MSRSARMGCRVIAFGLLALARPGTGTAQEVRQRLVDSALAISNPATRVAVLVKAVDPNLGAPDQRWVRAVVKLVEDLTIELRDPNADVWLRWAVRLYPQFAIDPVETEAEVMALLQRVRREVGSDAGPDTLATWDWSSSALSGNGTLRLNRSALPRDAQVRVADVGALADELRLPPRTYDIEVSLAGRSLGPLQREVLPGVTTVLNFRFPVPAVAVPPAPSAAPSREPAQSVRRGGGFPKVLVLGGLGVAGAAAALLLTHGGSGSTSTTGGIIITYPLPAR